MGLGTADSFAVLGGSTVTNTGPSVINGDLGLWPGTSVTGFGGPPNGTVNGTIHVTDAVAQQAQTDLTTAYNDAAGRTPAVDIPGADLVGLTFTPGVYHRAGALGLNGGDVALDAQGDSTAVFIFQIDSTLITGSGTRVLLQNGAQACNVFWQVGSSATLGTTTAFKGNILAFTSITLNSGATIIEGRALARNGAVTLDNNTITRAACATPPATPPSGGGGGGGGSSDTPTPTPTPTPPPSGDGGGDGETTPPPPGAIPPPPGTAVFTTLPREVAATVLRHGTRRSVRGRFRTFVTGLNIRRVTFTLDGHPIGTLSGRPPFEVAVRAPRGIHIVRAHVKFSDGSRAVHLRLRFRARGNATRTPTVPRRRTAADFTG